ncbi:MAG TPA: SDR family NAD(P)-dependent oxidoreductase [Kofleriaceae bacterium]|jgi:hypothetical protein
MRAVVTGASSGIGADIARELSRLGASLVLTARRADALAAVAKECEAATVVVADLGTPEGVATLAPHVRDADILVNNAGFGYFRRFAEADAARDAELVQLNIASLAALSRIFVDGRRGGSRAYLLNIASIAAYQSVPNFALYAASKAFVRNFTEALHDELRGTPLSATVVCPGGTHTAFHAAAGAGNYGWLANASMMSSAAVAKIGVRAMLRRKRTVVPGVLNKLSCWSVRFVPRVIASWAAGRVLGAPGTKALPARSGS